MFSEIAAKEGRLDVKRVAEECFRKIEEKVRKGKESKDYLRGAQALLDSIVKSGYFSG